MELGLAAIVALLAVKEAGVPIPIPGDLIVLGAGVAAANGRLDPRLAFPAIVIATVLGGIVQYTLVRGVGRRAVLSLLARLGVTEDRLAVATDRLRRAGGRGVAVARATPGIRVVAIPSAALAAVPLPAFVGGLAVGNGAFSALHFALGALVGPTAANLLGGLGLASVGVLVLLAIVGLVGWVAIRGHRRARADGARVGPNEREASSLTSLAAWADAACPACLALALIDPES